MNLKKVILATLLLCSVQCLLSAKTVVSIKSNQFYINGELTYSGRYWNENKVEGLLFNSRMVNGIFDDLNPQTASQFKYPDTQKWDAMRNTKEFVAEMKNWYNHGLLAFTLNMQGGSPMGYGNHGWINSAFEPNGDLREDYTERLKMVLDEADQLGMVVILGYFYFGADEYLKDEKAVINATRQLTEWILDNKYENVMVEIANECDIQYDHDILKPERICELIKLVQSITRDGRSLLASASLSGIKVPSVEICQTSDFVLLHGNGAKTANIMRDFLKRVRTAMKDVELKPIIVNEDDHYDFDEPDNNMVLATEEYISWGYFDFRRKGEAFEEGYQSIPASWGINTERKRAFFNKVKEITAFGQAPDLYSNPIIPGYHPDPSICRVGDEYYMVNSSFEWWPCMPIHKSKDLVNWELVGYGKVDPAKLPVAEGTRDSGGIFAATIRYHKGVFYLITTMIGGKGNFYITATDPTGEWSDPVWLHSQGIDPSLFWDDDDKCYYVGHGHPAKPRKPGHTSIWVQELDLKQGKLVGPAKHLSEGHSVDAGYPEGPHIYKHNGKYVLMIAEGGTGFTHSVTQFYSDSIFGPYQPNQINPILTHRHLGNDYHIQSVGHADIVQTQNNDWWMVALATRNFDGFTYLARETFLVPMEWEDTYGRLGMVVNRGVGKVLEVDKRPDLPWTPVKRDPIRDEFDASEMALKWNMLRSPTEKWYSLADGKLTMNVRPEAANKFVNPSLWAQRIQHLHFTASTRMNFNTRKSNEEAGIIVYRESQNYLTFTKKGDQLVILLQKGGKSEVLYTTKAPKGELILSLTGDGENISFKYATPNAEWKYIDVTTSLKVIGRGQFNGPMIGVYASSNDKPSKSKVEFDWFDFR